MAAEDHLARGASLAEARRLASLELGRPRLAIEKVRDGEFLTVLESLLRDLSLGLRGVRKNPVFFLIATLTLALGIGVNTAIFSLLYGLVLRGLPTQSPSELMLLGMSSTADESGYNSTFLTYPMLAALRKELTSFSDISGWCPAGISMEDGQGALRFYSGGLVTGNAFGVLPIRPYLGRMLAEYDNVRGGPPQGWPVVLSYGFWSDHYGKDPAILGKRIRVSGAITTVAGVAPPEFKGVWPGSEMKVYLPMQFINVVLKRDVLNSPNSMFGMDAIGRLRPGIAESSARAELARLRDDLVSRFIPLKLQHLRYIEGIYMRLDSARSGIPNYISHTYTKPLMMMQALVGLVLLLCCVNVGGLMMSKVYMRQREFAVRTALGAHISRLVRQYLTESLILAFAGSALGALFAWQGCDFLLSFFRDPMMGEPMEVQPDRSMLLFAGGLAVLTTLMFGVLPAWRAGHADPGELLRSRTTSGGRRHIAGRAFVPIQVAFSLVLVTLALLLSQSMLKIRSERTGFEVDHVTIQTSPLSVLAKKGDAKLNLYQRMIERLDQMPGVRSAAATSRTPMTGEKVTSHFQPIVSGPHKDNQVELAFNDVTPGYFRTMQVRITAGRSFAFNDRSLNVCVLNESAAEYLFPHEEALGRYVRAMDGEEFPTNTACRVIGIAEDAKFSDVRQPPPRTIYFPASIERIDRNIENLVFLINSNTKSSAIAGFRKTLSEIAPTVPLVSFVTLREQMDAALGSEELITLLSNFFGLVALLLSALGLYGLLSSSVVQRTGEIGIRLAVGADRGLVIRMILREALGLVGVGMALGVVALLFATRFIASQLHGISAFDPLTLLTVVFSLLAVTLIAALLPALRAATVDPIKALHAEY